MVLQQDTKGIYCPAGDFYIDPWKPVARAVITHAHGDHARQGSASYLCEESCKIPLSLRVGPNIQTLRYGEKLKIGDAQVSLHPAGHVLGSAQVRVEVSGEVWVVSGDYKRQSDPTCAPLEVVPCHTFITESTFALPVYRWRNPTEIMKEIMSWWQDNANTGKPSVLLSYVLGKTQRILASLVELDSNVSNIYAHGALQKMNDAYRESNIPLPETPNPLTKSKNYDFSQALIFAPPSALGTSWIRRFKNCAVGRASGWMNIRGYRRRLALDKGFVLSDHADWPALLQTIHETGAQKIITTHGNAETLARYLAEDGLQTAVMPAAQWNEQVEEAI